MNKFTLADLAQRLDGELIGSAEHSVNSLATLASATSNQLSFLSNPKYASQLKSCKAGAILIHPKQAHLFAGNKILVTNPYLAFAKISQLFAPPLPAAGFIHPSALVDPSAQLHPSVHLGPGVVIEANCRLDEGVIIGAHSVIGHDSVIGAHTQLYPRVTLYHAVELGQKCIVHSGAVIGADGFGFAPTGKDWLKIAQLGRVVIGDQVEIGANSTIDRGALGDTKVGRDVKIDNLVHLAHNVTIGDHTAMAAFVGISGSTEIGANCMLGGHSGLAGHIKVTDSVNLTGMAMVTGSVNEPGVYSSGTGLLPSSSWRKNAVRFRQLDDLNKKVKLLETQLEQLLAASAN